MAFVVFLEGSKGRRGLARSTLLRSASLRLASSGYGNGINNEKFLTRLDRLCPQSLSCLSAPRGRFQKQCSHTMCVLLFCMIVYLQAANYHTKQQTLPLGSACIAFELLTRLELVTSSLPRKCSTTELQQHFVLKAGQKYNFFLYPPNLEQIKCY